MAQLRATGWDLKLPSAEPGVTISNTVTSDTEKQFDGSACAKCAKAAENRPSFSGLTTTLGNTYFFQAALLFSGITPTANMGIMRVTAASQIEVSLLTNGKINVFNALKSESFAESPVIEANKTYLIEVIVKVPAAGKGTLRLLILKEDGSVFYDSGTLEKEIGNTAITVAAAGHISSETAVDVYNSHMILNDSTGTKENSNVGFRKVSYLRPKEDVSRAGFLVGAAATTNLFKGVSKAPPAGVAVASKTAESQIYDAVSNTTDNYVAKLFAPTEAIVSGGGGMSASTDSLKSIVPIARASNSTVTARSYGLALVLPESTETTANTNGVVTAADPTGWSTLSGTVLYPESVNSFVGGYAPGTSPTVKVRKNAASTDTMSFDAMGAYITYVPNAGSKPTATTVAAGAITNTTAILNSLINPNGAPTKVYFKWGPSEEIANETPEESAGEGTEPISKAKEITGLSEKTQYWFQVRATNVYGTVVGTGKLTFKTGPEGTLSKVSVRNSYPPDQIGISVVTPQGVPYRWAEDEPLPENVISGLTITKEIPGGDKSIGGVLNRDPQRDWPELQTFSEIEAYLGSGKRVFEGYLDKAPDVSGEQASITPAGLGWQAALDDDQTVEIGWISKLLDQFNEGSTAARVAIGGAGVNNTAESSVAGVGPGLTEESGIVWDFKHAEPAAGEYIGKDWVWDGQGLPIGLVYADFHGDGSTPWYVVMGTTKDGNRVTGTVAQAIYVSGGVAPTTIQGFVVSPGTTGKYFFIYCYYNNTTGAKFSMTNMQRASKFTFIGPQGLAYKGTWPNIGFSAQQMLVDLFSSKSKILTTKAANIDDDEFVIPQAWYPEGQKFSDIVKDLLKYGWYDWFVKKKEFYVRRPGTYGRVWKSTVAASNLNEVGQDSSRTWDRIKVQWKDVDGSSRTAGWPGSGALIESTELIITSSRNPAVAAGREKKYKLVFNGAITETTAIRLGKRFLEEAELINRSGSATLVAYVMDENGYFHPVSEVDAGDWIEFTDAHDSSPRKITAVNYSHEKRTNEIDLDAPPSGMDALLERLNAVLVADGV